MEDLKKNNVLFSETFKKFFSGLDKDAFTVEEMLDIIKNNVSEVTEEVFIGKMETILNAPSTIYEPEGKSGTITLFICPEGYSDEPYIETMQTVEKGLVTAFVYPKKGHEWSDEELSSIKVLVKFIFFLAGRSRVMGLLQKASLIDNITGVQNSVGFAKSGEMLHAKGILHNYHSVFLNIKNFKYINNSVGNPTGNKILRIYSQKIVRFLDKQEVFARLGGDNFIAFVKNEHIDDFINFISGVNICIEHNGGIKQFNISAKAGIFAIKENNIVADAMSCSSVALNIARANGKKDIVWFCPEMLRKTLHDKEVSSIFPQAVQCREFVVFYQPKVTLADNKLCGCEALVRWIRNGKIVPPMDFIPVLEREGTICKLDFYVFENVCHDIQKWISEGRQPVRVSVNFSKVHLQNENLADEIISIVKKYNVDPKYLEIELTEMSGHEDYDALASFVNRMKQNGINTSIDDFGTGYSSLNLLKDLKVDIIKLDKSFLDNIENTEKNSFKDEIVIKNIVNMVNELNMEVIAEGVETVQQAEFLKNINCCMAQGYLFDRPLPQNDFIQRLDNKTYSLSM